MADDESDVQAPVPDPRHTLGRRSEQRVRDFLLERGFDCLHENWRCRVGEVDLIMRERHSGVIVFVEVRYRASAERGSSLDTVGFKKRQRLQRTVRAWLQRHGHVDDRVRIDVIGVEPSDVVPTATGSDGGNFIVHRHGETLTWVVSAIEDDG